MDLCVFQLFLKQSCVQNTDVNIPKFLHVGHSNLAGFSQPGDWHVLDIFKQMDGANAHVCIFLAKLKIHTYSYKTILAYSLKFLAQVITTCFFFDRTKSKTEAKKLTETFKQKISKLPHFFEMKQTICSFIHMYML